MGKEHRLSEEALQIAGLTNTKRREVKKKGENERYPFECRVQRRRKRDKKVFLSNQ